MIKNKRLPNITGFGAWLLLAMALPGIPSFGADTRHTLPGHVPAAVAHLTPQGLLPATNQLHLAIGLPLRNEDALNQLLQEIYDPASTNYHRYLTPTQFAEQFGPTEQDYQAVIGFARTNGFAITATSGNRLLLDVTASTAAAERAFHVTLRVYRHPTENRDFFAPDTEPSVGTNIPIFHVTGLDNYFIPRPASIVKKIVNPAALGSSPASGSGSYGGYFIGNDFRAAYVPGTPLNGTGQTVGLFELDGYYASDITSYESLAKLPNITLATVLIDGYSGAAGGNNTEVALDIDMAIAMATNLSQVIVYEGPNPTGTLDILNRIVTDNLAKQISSSWVIGDNNNYDTYYKEMAAQGQSFFQASGDDGAYYKVRHSTIPQWADDTNITLVGGTTLSTTGAGGSWSSETVWNWYSTGQGTSGSGGGINFNNVPIPSWQQGINMTTNSGSTTLRNSPDVAMTADNIFIYADNGTGYSIGGTSAAAPLWAGFTALVNQQAAQTGNSTVGFINPAIYSIGKGTNYTLDFHDIVTGNNTNKTVTTNYSAVPGYDLCTGWGTPNGVNLINALAPPALPYFTTQPFGLNVTNGANVAFTVSAGGRSPLSYHWRFNGTNLTAGGNVFGVTSNTLTLTAVTSANAGNYSVVVTNNYGTITSSVASLTILLPAAFASSSFTNRTVQCGQNTNTFTITVSGTAPLSIQWSLNNAPLAGATNASFSLTNLDVSTDTISVTVTNLYSAASSNCTLIVVDTLPPVITLNGINSFYVELGSTFTDPGATAYDACAGAVPVTASGTVNAAVVGTDSLTYTANDGNGNTNTATRTVIVRDTAPPTIVWSFTNLVLAAGTNTDVPMPDVTGTNFILATDASGAVTITQNPTNAFPLSLGTNAVLLTAADLSGNAAYSTNQIIVAVSTNVTPVIASPVAQGGAVTLQLGGGYGLTYILESTTDLTSGNWQPLGTNTIGVSGVWQFTDTSATNFPQRFYRLESSP